MPAPIGNNYAAGNEGGRPSSYRDEYAEQAYKLCLLGHTDKELAEFFGIAESTLNLWKQSNKEFSESVTRGKVMADAEVAESLFKRAIGFEYNEVTFERVADKVTLEITPDELITQDAYKKKIVKKLLPGDVGAAKNWLSNRRKDKWRDGVDVTINKGADLDAYTAEEVEAIEAWRAAKQSTADEN